MAGLNPELAGSSKTQAANVFTPKSEWKEEDTALVLRVYLPGFTEKQISYKVEKRWRYIKVNGDPSTVYFDVSFDQIPEKYNLDEVKALFSGGMFIIRIPKINADEQQIASKEEEQATTSQATTPAPQEAAKEEAEPQKVEDKAPKEGEGWNIWMLVSVIIAIGTCIVYKVVESRRQN
ncbi:hypothetical protein Tsubulata_043393 [Turnera subulata]|uniref:SHSP domain-containing protein n=1 Tax=Turnera subulata TaxID=218843 RepID=A0A9Q0G833_9ROSI|nr:hypothetical protein Tsubulata_043393 [Turnera subulata]